MTHVTNTTATTVSNTFDVSPYASGMHSDRHDDEIVVARRAPDSLKEVHGEELYWVSFSNDIAPFDYTLTYRFVPDGPDEVWKDDLHLASIESHGMKVKDAVAYAGLKLMNSIMSESSRNTDVPTLLYRICNIRISPYALNVEAGHCPDLGMLRKHVFVKPDVANSVANLFSDHFEKIGNKVTKRWWDVETEEISCDPMVYLGISADTPFMRHERERLVLSKKAMKLTEHYGAALAPAMDNKMMGGIFRYDYQDNIY